MKNITTSSGKIFINSQETKDPEFIGYSIIDAVENENNIVITNTTEIELQKQLAIQDYLLNHGANDENVNDKIKHLKSQLN